MVKIRLVRRGAKKHPHYRIVVADSRTPRNGKIIENLGYYDPMKKPSEIKINMQAVKVWILKGAQPTNSVKLILKKSNFNQ